MVSDIPWDADKIALPGRKVTEILNLCMSDSSGKFHNKDYRTVYVWGGTADCTIPEHMTPEEFYETIYAWRGNEDCTITPQMSKEEFMTVCKKNELEQVREDLKSEKKYHQIQTDLRDLYRFIRENFNGDIRIVGPLPAYIFRNYELVKQIDAELAQGPNYLSIIDSFYSPNGEPINPEIHLDEIHLNARGYSKLEEILDRKYKDGNSP